MTNPVLPPAQSTSAAGWRSLMLLAVYHLLLGLALLLVQERNSELLAGLSNPQLFHAVIWFLIGYPGLAFLLTLIHRPSFELQSYAMLSASILGLLLLMHASGGVHSGAGLLLALSLAIGSLLTPGKAPFFFAAVAALGTIAVQTVDHLAGTASLWAYIHAGILGAAFFILATLVHALTTRLKAKDLTIRSQALDLANLNAVNAHVLEQLDNGILVVDHLGRVMTHNGSAKVLLGVPFIEPMTPLASLNKQVAQVLREWRHQDMPPDTAYPLGTGNGNDLEIRIKPLDDEHYQGAVISLESLDRLRKKAQEVRLATLGQMAATITHEIRNPLSAIVQAAQLIREQTDEAGKCQQFAEIIERNSTRLNRTIENVLQLARPNKLANRQKLPLCDLVERVATDIRTLRVLPPAELRVECHADEISASLDPHQFEEILHALSDNAVRHFGRGKETPLRLVFSVGIDTKGSPTVEITDNGPGISNADLEKIFDPFYSKGGGTGLGLYVAQELCAANGAKIQALAQTSERTGATFRITLPADRVAK